MNLSYKIKRLLFICISIIILVIAANEGHKYNDYITSVPSNIKSGISYPNYPKDMDPGVIDENFTNGLPNIPLKKEISILNSGNNSFISAETYFVGNLDTGEMYSKHNPNKVFPIASLSKLITAMIALHVMDSEKKITITQKMLDSYGEAGHLVLGEILTVRELLYPLLLESSNDAAETIAESFGYEKFIDQMNAFAIEQGMNSTSFKDSSGLNGKNISNAKDLFILAKYLYQKEKPLLEITKMTSMTLASTSEHGEHIWKTINPFSLDPHFIGGKTGRTYEAKESMISLFKYSYGIYTYPVAVIVLRSDFRLREIDTSTLFEQFIKKIQNN